MFVVPSHLRSWLEVPTTSHFSLQNVPFGVGIIEENEAIFTRIGNYAINISALMEEGLIPEQLAILHGDLEIEPEEATELRQALVELLELTHPKLRDNKRVRDLAILPAFAVEMVLPRPIGAFVDFYSGIHHASNVGKMFRPDMPPLLPNYRHLPVGYNGRASSVVVSGEPVFRPLGQYKPADSDAPIFGPTKELDFELEIGFLVGVENDFGMPIPLDEAEDAIFGYVLVNDWSARDIQRWEYQPLGPMLAKTFCTSISPWIVLKDALEPFRVQGMPQDPLPLPYLRQRGKGHYNIELEVQLLTEKMSRPVVISRSNTQNLYWSAAQQLAHQTSNGTPVEPGDLYASGTISGETPGSYGSLLELTWRGTEPISFPETGETRTFLEDGDTVTLTGCCYGDGFNVGFGEVSAKVFPAVEDYP